MTLQPLESQGWLEWAKMEDECGHVQASLRILRRGLTHLRFNESLLTKAIKQEERLHNIREARELLSVLRPEPIDKVWRAVFEGTLLEARAGETVVARKLFKYLMCHVKWYGPIYYEAFRMEEKCGNYRAALDIVQKGLNEISRYGPLWLGLIRLMERQDIADESGSWLIGIPPVLKNVREYCQQAVKNISLELVWKVHFEEAQIEERAAESSAFGLHLRSRMSLCSARHILLDRARSCYVLSFLSCPVNLRWKVWLAGARMELSAGRLEEVRRLLGWAYAEVPEKSRAHVYLECARVQEYVGDLVGARRILTRAREEIKGEWKIYLETILLEARNGNLQEAISMAEKGLLQHPGTGRLWAVLLQLTHSAFAMQPSIHQTHNWVKAFTKYTVNSDSLNSTFKRRSSSDMSAQSSTIQPKSILIQALGIVPKSGEVWCEGARTLLNPLLPAVFDLGVAQKYLDFAIRFTPQYGDTFVEYLRLEIIIQVILPRILNALGIPLRPFLKRFVSSDPESDTMEQLTDTPRFPVGLWDTKSWSVPSPEEFRSSRKKVVKAIIEMTSEHNNDNNLQQSFKEVSIKSLMRRYFLIFILYFDCIYDYLYDSPCCSTLYILLHRCSNAEPNYGSAWFYCRRHPIDTPADVLKYALNILTMEISSCQQIYARAVLLYVMRCLQDGEAVRSKCCLLVSQSLSSTTPESYVRDRADSGGAGGRTRRPSSAPSCSTPRKIIQITDSSNNDNTTSTIATTLSQEKSIEDENKSNVKKNNATSVSSGFALRSHCSFSSLFDGESSSPSASFKAHIEMVNIWSQQAALEREFLEDVESLGVDFGIPQSLSYEISTPSLPSFTSLNLYSPIVELHGSIYTAQDFVTSFIDHNRTFFTSNLSLENKRKILFGFDQITP